MDALAEKGSRKGRLFLSSMEAEELRREIHRLDLAIADARRHIDASHGGLAGLFEQFRGQYRIALRDVERKLDAVMAHLRHSQGIEPLRRELSEGFKRLMETIEGKK